MEIIACANCGRLFNYLQGRRVCSNCMKVLEEKFVEVKKYVREHPKVGVREVSQEMGVSVAQINRWIREERLVFSEDSAVGLPCERCGAMIRTGRYCNSCKQNLTNELRDASGLSKRVGVAPIKKRTATDNRMRFLDN